LYDNPSDIDSSKLLVYLIARSTTGPWVMAGTLLRSRYG
jgi:hypothetical protein